MRKAVLIQGNTLRTIESAGARGYAAGNFGTVPARAPDGQALTQRLGSEPDGV